MINLMHQKMIVVDVGLQCLLSVACGLKSMIASRLSVLHRGFVTFGFSGFPVVIRRTLKVF
jgi:hypothetical protein